MGEPTMRSVPAHPGTTAGASRGSFSTASVAAELRLPLWEEYSRRWFTKLDFRTFADAGLEARVRSTALGERLQITEMSSNDHIIERTPELIRSTPTGTKFLCILLAGEAFVYHSGGADLVSRGDAVLYDSDSPYVYGIPRGIHQLIVHVNSDVYADRHGRDVVRHPVIIRGADSPGLEAHIRAVLSHSREPLSEDPARASSLEAQALDLFSLIVSGAGGSSAAYWLSAREHIRRNVTDPKLSVRQVSRAVGISERHLARVFADHSATVGQVISEERIRRARELLLDPARARSTITHIAAMAGFTSPSHFARAFRKAYGCSARELRRAVGTVGGPGAQP
jgi:AraC-like DNA-binding protein